jgi:small subunit ribosomal protein S19e
MPGVCVRDVDPHKFINAYAAHLKRSGKVAVPSWVDLVKTSCAKEMAPYNPDWFYVRLASVARHIYLCPGVGVGAFNLIHGSKKRRGTRPPHHQDAAGSINRKALQALEKLNLLQKDSNGGRKITSEGQRDLDSVAAQVYAATH